MADILIRNLPDEVVARLKDLAAAERLSLNAVVTRELTRSVGGKERPGHNAAVMADLRAAITGAPLDADVVLAAIREGRR